MTKITCPKIFLMTKIPCPKNSHAQNHMPPPPPPTPQKKKKNSIPMTKITCPIFFFHNQNPHVQKFPWTQKSQCPTKMSPLPFFFFSLIHTTTKFCHSHAQRKNSYMTKTKTNSISLCTNKFSHSQNYDHTNFPRINITYPTKFFTSQNFITTKFSNTHKYIHAHSHKILPRPWNKVYTCK